MIKLAEIDSPIRCPHFHEGTCFNNEKPRTTGTIYPDCGWDQKMPEGAFPKDCPMPNITTIILQEMTKQTACYHDNLFDRTDGAACEEDEAKCCACGKIFKKKDI